MIANYYDIITKIENFAEGLVVIDNNCKVVYHKKFNSSVSFKEKDSVGKSLDEIFVDFDLENAPLIRAVKYGESSINKLLNLHFYTGEEVLTVSNIFPIRSGREIIGAISISQKIDTDSKQYYIDISNAMEQAPMVKLYDVNDIIGTSSKTMKLKSNILKVAETKSNVLIYGETGTGKELVAQSIHSHSDRNTRPFIVQNCAAIPQTLLESIFFGTTKGSFTGAIDKPGLFELADKGTIFLDEINSMDLHLQAKILRAIENKSIVRVGGSQTINIDVRIIAATNIDPRECISKGLLREDLYYRLSSVQIKLEPLRNRSSDIDALTEYYIHYYNKEMNKSIKGVSEKVNVVFKNYGWPGNVREFKNVIETAFNFADSDYIEYDDLPEYIFEERGIAVHDQNNLAADKSLKQAIEDFEKSYILSKVESVNSFVELADKLQISKQLLNSKIKKYNLDICFS